MLSRLVEQRHPPRDVPCAVLRITFFFVPSRTSPLEPPQTPPPHDPPSGTAPLRCVVGAIFEEDDAFGGQFGPDAVGVGETALLAGRVRGRQSAGSIRVWAVRKRRSALQPMDAGCEVNGEGPTTPHGTRSQLHDESSKPAPPRLNRFGTLRPLDQTHAGSAIACGVFRSSSRASIDLRWNVRSGGGSRRRPATAPDTTGRASLSPAPVSRRSSRAGRGNALTAAQAGSASPGTRLLQQFVNGYEVVERFRHLGAIDAEKPVMHPEAHEGVFRRARLSLWASSFSWCGKIGRGPPPWMSKLSPRCASRSLPSTRCASRDGRAPGAVPAGLIGRRGVSTTRNRRDLACTARPRRGRRRSYSCRLRRESLP